MTSMGLASNWPGGNKTVTIQNRGVTGRDAQGNDTYGVTSSYQANVILVPLQMKLAPRATRGSSFAEELQGETIVASGYTMFAEYGIPVGEFDYVLIDGETWRVAGVPGNYSSPFTGAAGLTQVELIRITGLCGFFERKLLAVMAPRVTLLPLANAPIRGNGTTGRGHSIPPALGQSCIIAFALATASHVEAILVR